MNIVKDQGLPDFLMLDSDKVTEDGFMDNLKLRFEKKQVYTYIGEQVVSMNPYQLIPGLYEEKTMDEYKRKYMYEVQPHIFALADDTFRALMNQKHDQCVIVTGESGAGKTEATKYFMKYLAKVSASHGDAEAIKEKLLDSNPVLEAFGNAKTLRNDNSSRFGKYMEIQFDGAGKPLGGKISQYLLEKGRVVTRQKGERAFHIFYLMLSAAKVQSKLGVKDPFEWNYLKLSECKEIDGQNDATEFRIVEKAMTNLGFNEATQDTMWRTLLAILALGNVDFTETKEMGGKAAVDHCKVADDKPLARAAEFMRVKPELLDKSLRTRLITTGVSRRQSRISVLLNVEQARDTRDSLAKAMYDAIFDFVVLTLNKNIVGKTHEKAEVVVGILDIYGFEIFQSNSFEQFCINYCNEKLQQLFIDLVLLFEQEEYLREGIQWTKIDYFDNAPIVELIEGKTGLLALLDEACMVGKSTPKTLLEKFDDKLGKNPFYMSWGVHKDKSIHQDAFRIKHYAGAVDYHIEHFLSKNRDTLYEDLCKLILSSEDALLHPWFPIKDATARRERPKMAGVQFEKNVNELIRKLKSCFPHYVRCIKPNDDKKPFFLNEERVRHQVRYLNLVETVRVRRAGFCNRQKYERFYFRYHLISSKTWPSYKGSPKDGVQAILDDLKVEPSEYRMGKTQLFIRNAKTLFFFEEKRAEHMPKVATAIQRRWRGYKGRVFAKKVRLAWTVQRVFRAYKVRVATAKMLAARKIQRMARKRQARMYAKALKLQIKQQKAAVEIQRAMRGRKGRVFVKKERERLKMEKEERERHRKADKLQNAMRRHLHRKWFKQVVAVQTEAKYPANYGKDVPAKWPKAKTQLSKQVMPIAKKLAKVTWAKQKIAYFRGVQVMQKLYRARLATLYMAQLRNTFTTEQKKPPPNFGKALPYPKPITAALKTAEPILRKIHIADWGRRKIKYFRATERIQRRFRERQRRLYVNKLCKTFEQKASYANKFTKGFPFPPARTAALKTAHPLLMKMHRQHWGHQKLKILTPEQRALVKQKIQAMALFHARKPWDPSRDYGADYMDVDSNPNRQRFVDAIHEMFQKFGDTAINFADDVIKVNRHGKSQHQVVIVTDKNVYKYTPGKYKIIKSGVPLTSIKAIRLSPLHDTFIVIEFSAPARDMVLNLGTNGCERYAELATVLFDLVSTLKHEALPVMFEKQINYNNGRDAKNPGKDMVLTFADGDPKEVKQGESIWKSGKGNSATIFMGPPATWAKRE